VRCARARASTTRQGRFVRRSNRMSVSPWHP